jgi:hypothetical protein
MASLAPSPGKKLDNVSQLLRRALSAGLLAGLGFAAILPLPVEGASKKTTSSKGNQNSESQHPRATKEELKAMILEFNLPYELIDWRKKYASDLKRLSDSDRAALEQKMASFEENLPAMHRVLWKKGFINQYWAAYGEDTFFEKRFEDYGIVKAANCGRKILISKGAAARAKERDDRRFASVLNTVPTGRKDLLIVMPVSYKQIFDQLLVEFKKSLPSDAAAGLGTRITREYFTPAKAKKAAQILGESLKDNGGFATPGKGWKAPASGNAVGNGANGSVSEPISSSPQSLAVKTAPPVQK